MSVTTEKKTARLVALLAAGHFFLYLPIQSGNNAWASEVAVPDRIVSERGYDWPQKARSYWPTSGWISSPMVENGIDPDSMATVNRKAQDDRFIRSILVVKNGYLVYERYYHGGAPDQSTEVWSVTKSIVSALVGIAIDSGAIENIDDLMVDYLPDYPEFQDLTIRHVISHTTRLEWTEQGDDFVGWIESDDWVGNAVRRKRLHHPGDTLLYSSGNSHFLSALIRAATEKTPGQYAKDKIFDPLGIRFQRRSPVNRNPTWDDFLVRTPGTWKQDSQGTEVGAFGLSLTAREMAKFGYLFLNKGRWEDQVIVSDEWVEESIRDHVLQSNNFGFGYHWVVSERSEHLAFNADGWGGQIICVIPDLDMVVVIKSESESPASHPYYDILEDVITAAIRP